MFVYFTTLCIKMQYINKDTSILVTKVEEKGEQKGEGDEDGEGLEGWIIAIIVIFQVQIIHKYLRIFISRPYNIEKNFHIKLPINIYKSNNKIRNLQENAYREQEVDLYLSENNEVVQGEILSLTSIEEFDESDRIIINKDKSHGYEIRVLNNNNKILDTQENKKMIENKEIIDFSEVPSTFTSNKYYIVSSSKGCHFNLVSKNQIEEENQNVILNFIEKIMRIRK